MNDEAQITLSRLIRFQRVAALGTLRDGGPLVSMVLYAPALDFSAFYIHISRLAQHTQDLLGDPRAGLMIAEPDLGQQDPQTLARLSLRGAAQEIAPTDAFYPLRRELYLGRFPSAAALFQLADFSLFEFRPYKIRYVAGFAQAFNLQPVDLAQAAMMM